MLSNDIGDVWKKLLSIFTKRVRRAVRNDIGEQFINLMYVKDIVTSILKNEISNI